MRSWATFLEALGGVRPFEHILETIRTGRPGFEIEFGSWPVRVPRRAPRDRGDVRRRDVRADRRIRAQRRRVLRLLRRADGRRRRRRHGNAAGRDPAPPHAPDGVLFETADGRGPGRGGTRRDRDRRPLRRCWQGTSSTGSRRQPTATCWRTCSTTGTTRAIGRDPEQLPSRDDQGRQGPDRRAADTRGRWRPGAHPAQRHQHARDHRRSRAHQRRVRRSCSRPPD